MHTKTIHDNTTCMLTYQVTFHAQGHPNVLSTHKSTLEFTKNSTLTTKGDCILGVASTLACNDLPENVKQALKHPNGHVTLTLSTIINQERVTDIVHGRTHPSLTLTHTHDMVIRKSTFTCNRTLFINADKAAKDIDPRIIQAMQHPTQKLQINLVIEIPEEPNEKDEITT